MNHPDFIVWMVAFPIANAVCNAIQWTFCERRAHSVAVHGQVALITLSLWFVVGALLW